MASYIVLLTKADVRQLFSATVIMALAVILNTSAGILQAVDMLHMHTISAVALLVQRAAEPLRI